MPLILGRKAGQKLIITLAPDADPLECLRALQADGIEITVKEINDHRTMVRLMIDAPRELRVLRDELVEHDDATTHLKQCGTGRIDGDNDDAPHEALCQ
ncbi:carbon storage regulator [Pseudomonas sp. MAP12]|uniref:Translational regulator CsrA n=1 Tax=Geopseudomonas aromaticivorans TaxID=2849492 RepID=A0ABS6MT92_9GAMM|nr:carbon storage regulator [Pseudomonas aromaticivorans]MBV2132022.1 carbon storage regulator [Pseudomonas aromaticivorans]